MAIGRRQFTIRGLMIAVAVIAGTLGLALNQAELVPLLIIVGIPLGGLIGLPRRVPTDRPGWRIGVRAAMLGWVILAGGALWGQSLVWWFKHQEKLRGIGAFSYAHRRDFWCLNVPLAATAFCLVAHVLGLARFCRGRHQYVGCLFVTGYATALAVAFVLIIIVLELQLSL
jgi:hypothetical protein